VKTKGREQEIKKVKAIIGLLILISVVCTILTGSARSVGSGILHKDGIQFDQKYDGGDGVNTTNPYTDINSTPLDERYLAEGSRPLNVLIFADEEEQVCSRMFNSWGEWYLLDWENYAVWQIERGDEALVAEFGIDIRVRGVLTWDSDDNKEYFYDLLYEFWYENAHYLRNEYNGIEIDAIIGITAQSTVDNLAGLAYPDHTVVLLRWQAYWADDNLVQHEVSHLFYADDHYEGWCIMADWEQLLFWIEEEGIIHILGGVYVSVTYRTHEYCSDCYNTINNHKDRFPIPPGDADLDGDVDLDDFLIWNEHFGETYPSWELWVAGVDPDFNNDGIVDLDDFLIWNEHFGET